MKKLMYGVIGVLLGFLVYTSLLIKTPKFVNFTNLSYGSDLPTTSSVSNDYYSDKYSSASPDYFNGYYLSYGDLETFKSEGTIRYGRDNPMGYSKYTSTPSSSTIDDQIADAGNKYDDTGESDVIDMSDASSVEGLDTKTGKMKRVNVDDIKQAILENGVLPVDESLYNVTSGFGYRTDPFDKTTKFHQGLDISSQYINGREVMSVLDGVIVFKSTNKGYGNYIVVNHGSFDTLYAHLEGFARNSDVGTMVKAGDVLGYVGSTGRSTGPHLHMEFDVDWVRVDPRIFMNLLTNETNDINTNVDLDYYKQKYGR